MYKLINIAWVKIANKRRFDSKINVNKVEEKNNSTNVSLINWVKNLINQLTLLYKSPNFYTTKNTIFNLLDKSFTHYPHNLLLRLKRIK